jgi:hypothetical protein
MRIMKSMANKKLKEMGMKWMRTRVIHECLGVRERKNLCIGDREPQRVLKLDSPFHTGIYSD